MPRKRARADPDSGLGMVIMAGSLPGSGKMVPYAMIGPKPINCSKEKTFLRFNFREWRLNNLRNARRSSACPSMVININRETNQVFRDSRKFLWSI